jgi:hypothetical protein
MGACRLHRPERCRLGRRPAGARRLGRRPARAWRLGRRPAGARRLGRRPAGAWWLGRRPARAIRLGRRPARAWWLGRRPARAWRLGRRPAGARRLGRRPARAWRLGRRPARAWWLGRRPARARRLGRPLRGAVQRPARAWRAGAWLLGAYSRPDLLAALWLPGVLVGLALFAGYVFQTFGLRETTPAKAGFITGHVGGAGAAGPGPLPAPAAAAQLADRGRRWPRWGLALLTPCRRTCRVSRGDLLVLACAVAFAAHILLTGRYAPEWRPLRWPSCRSSPWPC